MNFQKLKIDDIQEADYNPRKKLNPNDKEYQEIKRSIEEFGYVQPLIVNKDHTIIGGHQRLTVLRDLGYTEIDVIVVDVDKTQEKALNIALNKITGRWDNRQLDNLLKELGQKKFDLSLTGFKPDTSFQFGQGENQRINTYNHYNMGLYDPDMVDGKYQFPVIQAEDYVPDDLIGFNYMMTSNYKNCGVHCYVDDYQFERLWNKPDEYIDKLFDYQCLLSPDFSLYMNMPLAMKIWNVYRSRMLGQYYQRKGIIVIPTVSWAEKETFEFCFDGLPSRATLSISTVGVKKDPESMQVWKDGVDEMMIRLKPKKLLVYGGKVEYDYGNTEVVYYDNHVTERMKMSSGKRHDE